MLPLTKGESVSGLIVNVRITGVYIYIYIYLKQESFHRERLLDFFCICMLQQRDHVLHASSQNPRPLNAPILTVQVLLGRIYPGRYPRNEISK